MSSGGIDKAIQDNIHQRPPWPNKAEDKPKTINSASAMGQPQICRKELRFPLNGSLIPLHSVMSCSKPNRNFYRRSAKSQFEAVCRIIGELEMNSLEFMA